MNNCSFVGRLTADPEIKNTQTGIEYCDFRLAIDRPFKNKEGKREADFLPFRAWKQTAAFIKTYFHRGDMIGVTGPLRSYNYENADGDRRTIYTIDVEHAEFAGSKRNSSGEHPAESADPPPPEEPGSEEPLPF